MIMALSGEILTVAEVTLVILQVIFGESYTIY